MLGDLIMASSTIVNTASGIFLDSSNSAASNRIYFGDILGPYIYVPATGGGSFNGVAVVAPEGDGNTNTGLTVYGGKRVGVAGLGGTGVHAFAGDGTSSGGYGVRGRGGAGITADGAGGWFEAGGTDGDGVRGDGAGTGKGGKFTNGIETDDITYDSSVTLNVLTSPLNAAYESGLLYSVSNGYITITDAIDEVAIPLSLPMNGSIYTAPVLSGITVHLEQLTGGNTTTVKLFKRQLDNSPSAAPVGSTGTSTTNTGVQTVSISGLTESITGEYLYWLIVETTDASGAIIHSIKSGLTTTTPAETGWMT